ncbi:MAG: hypothetical protein CL942_14785 [Desulfovibrio sp.]|nr:hypothetical protein [Desulfovibrio sp.]MBC18305.1 hypothetical protein [Desulfovibrio sp.]|tara:strand:+ start:37690 stop:38184 length:495 start_codon:yes stop_codon:yes gene_type:complete
MPDTKQYFWSSWPQISQDKFFRNVLVGMIILTLAVTVGLRLFATSITEEIASQREMYGNVAVIVEDIKSLRAQQGGLAHLSVNDAVWFIIDDIQIETKLISIRETTVNRATEGLQVTFEGLSLTELMGFLTALRDKASLQTPSCMMTRNMNDPRLADVHLIVAR